MSSGKDGCAQCGAFGRLWKWTGQPCADKRRLRVFWLCDSCDIARNREILLLVGDKRAGEKIAAYADKVRRTAPAALSGAGK